MKKKRKQDSECITIHPEYNFTGGVRGKHHKAMQQGYTIRIRQANGTVIMQQVEPPEGAVILEPDARAYFPDSEAVNRTLRTLISLIPEKNKTTKK